MNRNAQILLFIAWITIGGILIMSEIQFLSSFGFFFLATGLLAIITNFIQKRKGSNTPLLSIGPAIFKKVINKSEHADFRERLTNSLDVLPYKVERMDDDKIVLKVGWSIWSWGEIIKIDFSDDKTISISSRCKVPLQMIDYGKNRENVERLVSKILFKTL